MEVHEQAAALSEIISLKEMSHLLSSFGYCGETILCYS